MRYVFKEPKHPLFASKTEKVNFFSLFPFAFSRQLLIHQAAFLIVFSSSKLVSRFSPGPMFTLFLIYEIKNLQHDAMFPMAALASWLPSVTSHHMAIFSKISAQCWQLCFEGIWIFAFGRKTLYVVLPHPCYSCSQLNPTLASDVSDTHHPHGHLLETF